MNYYSARQKTGKSEWHYTCMNNGHIWPTGACSDGQCKHDTPEDAYAHQTQYERDMLQNATHKLIKNDFGEPTKDGARCFVRGCNQKAFVEKIVPEVFMYPVALCDHHLIDIGWHYANDRMSSY